MYNVTKDSISNKCCSFELSIHQRILGKKWYKTVFNIDYALGSSQRVCCLLCLFKRIWPSPCKQSECNFDYPWKWSKVVKHKPHYPSFMAKMLWF